MRYKLKRLLVLVTVSASCLCYGAIVWGQTGVDTKGAKNALKTVAMDPSNIGLIVVGVGLLLGVVEILKKYGLIKSPESKKIAHMAQIASILMPEGTPVDRSLFYELIDKLGGLNGEEMTVQLKSVIDNQSVAASQARKIVKLLEHIALNLSESETERLKLKLQLENGE